MMGAQLPLFCLPGTLTRFTARRTTIRVASVGRSAREPLRRTQEPRLDSLYGWWVWLADGVGPSVSHPPARSGSSRVEGPELTRRVAAAAPQTGVTRRDQRLHLGATPSDRL
jgi:hypothetical protein